MSTRSYIRLPFTGKSALRIFSFWFCMALGVGAARLLEKAPPAAIGLTVWSLVATLLVSYWRSVRFRHWVLSLDVRHLILLHSTRFVGICFLILYSHGRLPYAFAVPGGWGDIAVAATGVIVAMLATRKRLSWSVLLWNLIGLLDILFVVMTAMRLALGDPGSMAALMRMPLSLLPTFLVPIIIASHIFIFLRLRTSPIGSASPGGIAVGEALSK
jgi:hypothetical protein